MGGKGAIHFNGLPTFTHFACKFTQKQLKRLFDDSESDSDKENMAPRPAKRQHATASIDDVVSSLKVGVELAFQSLEELHALCHKLTSGNMAEERALRHELLLLLKERSTGFRHMKL
jgi:hypothetical protein